MAFDNPPPSDLPDTEIAAPVEVEPEKEVPVTVDAAVSGSAPETIQLASTLTPERQKEIADLVCKDFETDWDSSEKYRKRRTKIFKLAVGDIPAPASGEKFHLARIHYPIIMTAVLRVASRIYDQQFPSNGEFFGIKPTDASDLERSIRIAKHLNWQINHEVPEYVPNHDILIEQCLLYGSAFSYIYRDPVKERTCHEACRTEDIVLPYLYPQHAADPSLAGIPRITRKVRLYKYELKRNSYYINIDKIYDDVANGQATSDPEGQYTSGDMQKAVDKEDGYEKPPEKDTDAPRVLLEQHRWLEIEDGDEARPVIAVVDYGTKNLLSLTLREDEDPVDRARYNREKDAGDAMYKAAMEQFAADMAAYEMGQMIARMPTGMGDMTAPPLPGEQTMTAPPIPGAIDSTLPGPSPPQMPVPPPEPRAPKMIPINFFTHFICFPNPEGVYGLGIGTLLEGHNVAADTLASQFVDAASLSNTATALASRQAKLRGGDIEISPGKVNRTDLSTQELKDGIQWLKFNPPEQAMRQLIGDMIEEAEKLSGANEILSGEVGGSNETATTTQIRIGQAMASITIMSKRYSRARTCEGQKFVRLNSVYVDDEEFFAVVDPAGPLPMEPTKIARRDYLEDCDVTVTADPRMASQPQRFQEAVTAWNFVNSSPLLAQNMPLVMAVAKNLFLAMDRPDLLQAFLTGNPMMGMMGAPPGGPQQPGQGAPPPEGGPPQNGAGKPHPEPVSTVPNGGNQPVNGEMLGQGA